MVRQWKRSLSQSDILSDGIPFDGSNIDQPISEAGGGTNFANLIPFSESGTESEYLLAAGETMELYFVSGSGTVETANISVPNEIQNENNDGVIQVEVRILKDGQTIESASGEQPSVATSILHGFNSTYTLEIENIDSLDSRGDSNQGNIDWGINHTL